MLVENKYYMNRVDGTTIYVERVNKNNVEITLSNGDTKVIRKCVFDKFFIRLGQ